MHWCQRTANPCHCPHCVFSPGLTTVQRASMTWTSPSYGRDAIQAPWEMLVCQRSWHVQEYPSVFVLLRGRADQVSDSAPSTDLSDCRKHVLAATGTKELREWWWDNTTLHSTVLLLLHYSSKLETPTQTTGPTTAAMCWTHKGHFRHLLKKPSKKPLSLKLWLD